MTGTLADREQHPRVSDAVNLKANHMAVGENQWYHFGVGAPPILVYFGGDCHIFASFSQRFRLPEAEPSLPTAAFL